MIFIQVANFKLTTYTFIKEYPIIIYQDLPLSSINIVTVKIITLKAEDLFFRDPRPRPKAGRSAGSACWSELSRRLRTKLLHQTSSEM